MDHHDHSAHANHNNAMDHSQHTMVDDHSSHQGHDGHDHGDGASECKMNMLVRICSCYEMFFFSLSRSAMISNLENLVFSLHHHQLHFGACETILFSSWVANTAAKFAVAFIAIFILAILYEGLKYYREKWFNEKLQSELARNGTLLKSDQTWRAVLLDKHHLAQTAMHLLQVTISYILMLIIMIANVWLCLAVVLGACCGYFLFGWVRQNAIDVTEHCH
jgi:solute carrier family 31 (copper transporter), member 1